MIDVKDGKYAGPMTVKQTIEQYKYRAGIHLYYIEAHDGSRGSEAWHWWAINGYEEGIRHLEGKAKCTVAEAFATIGRLLLKMFGGKK